MSTNRPQLRPKLAQDATTALRFDDDAYRRNADQAELAELEEAAEYHRRVIENDDPECDATIAALEEGLLRTK